MDAARLGAGWIVTCIIGGLVVTVAGLNAMQGQPLIGALFVVAGVVAICIGALGIGLDVRRWLRARRGAPRARAVDRAAIAELATAAWQEVTQNRGLTNSAAPNADARQEALRLWSDKWMLDVERALGDDEAALEVFKRDVDTRQMHYVAHPAFVLQTRLRRLGDYIPATVRVEMNLQQRFDTEGDEPAPPRT